MKVEMPLGDVVDRVTILELKLEHIRDPNALQAVAKELNSLQQSWDDAGLPDMTSLDSWRPLCAVNAQLWEVEDRLRALEQRERFDDVFVELARSVYKLNDQRAALKRALSLSLGSSLVEQKSYDTSDHNLL